MTSLLEAFADARADAGLTLVAPRSRLELLTEAVVARLKDKLPPSIWIERFPSRPADYDMQGRDAVVLVLCNGGQFARSPTPNTAVQKETVTIVAPILVRSLDGAHGAPSLIEDVRLALQGASLAGGTAIQPIGWSLTERDDDIFRFDFEFETTLPAVSASSHPGMR